MTTGLAVQHRAPTAPTTKGAQRGPSALTHRNPSPGLIANQAGQKGGNKANKGSAGGSALHDGGRTNATNTPQWADAATSKGPFYAALVSNPPVNRTKGTALPLASVHPNGGKGTTPPPTSAYPSGGKGPLRFQVGTTSGTGMESGAEYVSRSDVEQLVGAMNNKIAALGNDVFSLKEGNGAMARVVDDLKAENKELTGAVVQLAKSLSSAQARLFDNSNLFNPLRATDFNAGVQRLAEKTGMNPENDGLDAAFTMSTGTLHVINNAETELNRHGIDADLGDLIKATIMTGGVEACAPAVVQELANYGLALTSAQVSSTEGEMYDGHDDYGDDEGNPHGIAGTGHHGTGAYDEDEAAVFGGAYATANTGSGDVDMEFEGPPAAGNHNGSMNMGPVYGMAGINGVGMHSLHVGGSNQGGYDNEGYLDKNGNVQPFDNGGPSIGGPLAAALLPTATLVQGLHEAPAEGTGLEVVDSALGRAKEYNDLLDSGSNNDNPGNEEDQKRDNQQADQQFGTGADNEQPLANEAATAGDPKVAHPQGDGPEPKGTSTSGAHTSENDQPLGNDKADGGDKADATPEDSVASGAIGGSALVAQDKGSKEPVATGRADAKTASAKKRPKTGDASGADDTQAEKEQDNSSAQGAKRPKIAPSADEYVPNGNQAHGGTHSRIAERVRNRHRGTAENTPTQKPVIPPFHLAEMQKTKRYDQHFGLGDMASTKAVATRLRPLTEGGLEHLRTVYLPEKYYKGPNFHISSTLVYPHLNEGAEISFRRTINTGTERKQMKDAHGSIEGLPPVTEEMVKTAMQEADERDGKEPNLLEQSSSSSGKPE